MLIIEKRPWLIIERGDPSWTKEMGCQSSTPRVHGFQTCRSFVASALNSPTEPSGVHHSRTIGEVSILSADSSSTFSTRKKQFPRVFERIKMFLSISVFRR